MIFYTGILNTRKKKTVNGHEIKETLMLEKSYYIYIVILFPYNFLF